MYPLPLNYNQRMIPGLSSQTSGSWPIQIPADRSIVVSVSHDAGRVTIQPLREQTWETTMGEVLIERADLWDRLADL